MSEFQNEKYTDVRPLCVKKIRRSSSRKEIGAEFVLPDYMGDVKRVLKYTALATPCNTLISDNEASFLAIVSFRVTYLDGDDMLTEACFSADAEFSEKLPSGSVSLNAEYKTGAVTVRLGGPRKISAKTAVSCEASIVEEIAVCEKNSYDGAESLKKELEIHTVEYLKCSEREYAEEIDKINEASADEFEVVKSTACAFIDAVHKTEGGINLSGYADACVLLRGEDGIVRLEKRIPIEEHIECDLKDSSFFVPLAYVSSSTVNLNNISGENECAVSVVMNMTVECTVAHHFCESYTAVSDAFFEGCKNKCTYESLEYSSLGTCVFEKAALNITLDRGEEPLYDILESGIEIKNLRCELSGAEADVFCDAELHMIARGGTDICYPIKEKAEFSKKYRMSGAEGDKIEVNAVPCEISVSFDASKIYVEAQLLISLISEKKQCESVLSGISCEREEKGDGRLITVYYPDESDTLWSVSKKYGISMDKISSMNEIHNGSIENCSRIVIVK